MNKNREIRQAIKLLLTETGSYNVYDSRFLKIPAGKLPAISIYSSEENAETTQDQGGQVRYSYPKIVLYAKGKDAIEAAETGEKSVDEIIDDMLDFIQTKLVAKYQTLGKKVFWLRYKGFKLIEDISGADIVLICETMWEARYHVDTETT